MISKTLLRVTAVALGLAAAAAPTQAEPPTSNARRWQGEWDATKTYTAEITATGGNNLEIIVRHGDIGRKDPQKMTGTVAEDGTTVTGKWASDPTYDDGEKKGKRLGTFKITLKDLNHISGTADEDKTSILGSRTWPFEWTRK